MVEITEHIRQALDEISVEVLADFNRITESWSHKPEFVITIDADAIRIYTEDEIFWWVNDGTAPHVINAVQARKLAFAESKIPKTFPGVIGSGPGAASGLVFRRSVFNPGIKARHFDMAIYEKWSDKIADLFEQKVVDPLVEEFDAEADRLFAGGLPLTLPG